MAVREQEIEEAREVIENGGAVIFPTETAYGIAVDATNPESVNKVYKVKDRPRSKGLTTIVSSLGQAEKHAELSDTERKIVEELMPGPITLVAEKKDSIPDELNEKFAFRIPGKETARKLAKNTPITATSANISGNKTSYSVDEIDKELREKVDSTVAELTDNDIRIHREGPIKKRDVTKLV